MPVIESEFVNFPADMEHGEIRLARRRLETASRPPRDTGARAHGFMIGPPLPEPEVAAFEQRYRIVLPDEYRLFLSEVESDQP